MQKRFVVKLQMIHNLIIKIDKSSSLIYPLHIQINMKNWQAQQLDMTNFWVAAWLDDREVLCNFLFYLIVQYLCVSMKLCLLFWMERHKTNIKYE